MTHNSKPSPLVSQRVRQYVLGTLGISLCILGLSLILFRLPYLDGNSGDFKQDYYAAQQFLVGKSIYSSPHYPNNHPPFVALLFIPWALLPYHQSILIWTVLSIVLFFLTGWIVVHELGIKLRLEWILILTGLSLCWYPLQTHIALGQLSILISFCIIAGWAFLRRNQELIAGILLGLATLIKLFPGLIVIYLLIYRRWLALASMLAVVGIGELLSILLIGKDDFVGFFLQVSPKNAQKYIPFPGNISLSGALARLFKDGPWVRPLINLPAVADILTILATLGIIILLIIHMRKMLVYKDGNNIAFSINILAMLLISPLMWQHIFPILVLPLGLLFARLQTFPNLPTQRVLLLTILMISLPDFEIGRALMAYYAPYRMPWFAALIFLIPTMSLIILWALVIGKRAIVSEKEIVS